MTLLLCTSVPRADVPLDYFGRLADTSPFISALINIFESVDGVLPSPAHPRIQVTNVVGMKGLLWKRVSPIMHDYVWFLDGDLRFSYPSVPVNAIKTMRRTRAGILQPRVFPTNHGKFGRHRDDDRCVVRSISMVEVQAPLFSRSAWNEFYEVVLRNIDDQLLRTHVGGLDLIWCKLIEERLNAMCVLSQLETLYHTNTKTIEKHLGKKSRDMRLLRRLLLSATGRSSVRYPSRNESVRRCFDAQYFTSVAQR